MRRQKHLLQFSGFALLACLLVFALSLPVSAGTLNQTDPTATPNDPVWRAFSTVRDAIQKKKSVNLAIIKSYDWEQSEWKDTIDGCIDLEDPNEARKIYFGWTFNVTDLRGTTYQARISFDTKEVAVCDKIVTEAPAAPAGTPNPNLPTPVPGSAATGGFELGGQALDMNLNTFNLMKRAGMNWVKQQVGYNLNDDPGKVATQINVAHNTGFKIMLSIKGTKEQLASNFDSYINSYAGFVAGAAGLGADAIEVWNEPNIDREWPTGQVNGGSYTKMLAAAFNAAKAKNPNTIIISAAPAPTGFFGAAGCNQNGCNDDTFMAQMAQAGAAQYMDCVGLHYNEGIIPPSQGSGDPRGSYPTYYFSSMLARGFSPFGGKKVCFTELGYLSGEGYSIPIPDGFAWAKNTTVAQQAAWLAEAATLAAQSGKVRLMIVFNVDFAFYTATDPQGGYAMFRPGGQCPSCDTLGAVMKK
jgi:hypothetical protein